MGGGGGGGKKKPNFSNVQGELATQLFEQTDPIRQLLLGRSEDFLGGGADVTQSPVFQDLQRVTSTSFNRAKDNTIARFAPGGGLIDALTDLEAERAGVLSSGAAQIHESELDRAIALGTGATGLALGSLGQAGQVQAMKAQASAERDAGKAQGTGAAVGGIVGGK